jgi:hypothetical protein
LSVSRTPAISPPWADIFNLNDPSELRHRLNPALEIIFPAANEQALRFRGAGAWALACRDQDPRQEARLLAARNASSFGLCNRWTTEQATCALCVSLLSWAH